MEMILDSEKNVLLMLEQYSRDALWGLTEPFGWTGSVVSMRKGLELCASAMVVFYSENGGMSRLPHDSQLILKAVSGRGGKKNEKKPDAGSEPDGMVSGKGKKNDSKYSLPDVSTGFASLYERMKTLAYGGSGPCLSDKLHYRHCEDGQAAQQEKDRFAEYLNHVNQYAGIIRDFLLCANAGGRISPGEHPTLIGMYNGGGAADYLSDAEKEAALSRYDELPRAESWLCMQSMFLMNIRNFNRTNGLKPAAVEAMNAVNRMIAEQYCFIWLKDHTGRDPSAKLTLETYKDAIREAEGRLPPDRTEDERRKSFEYTHNRHMVNLIQDLTNPNEHFVNQEPEAALLRSAEAVTLTENTLEEENLAVSELIQYMQKKEPWPEPVQSWINLYKGKYNQLRKKYHEEEERMQREINILRIKNRIKNIVIGVLAVLLAGILGTVLAVHLAAGRKEVRYFADYVWKNGIPAGIHSLTAGEAKDRFEHYEFSATGGVLREVSHVRSDGTLIDESIQEDRAARMLFQYSEDGAPLYVQMFAEDGSEILAKMYSRGLGHVDLMDAATLSSPVYLPFDTTDIRMAGLYTEDFSGRKYSGICRYVVAERDAEGREIRVRYQDGDEQKKDGNGVAGYSCSYDETTGRLSGVSFEYDSSVIEDGALLKQIRYRYTGDLLTEREFVYGDGSRNYCQYFYNANGSCESKRYSGDTVQDRQWETVRYKYDERGNIISVSYELRGEPAEGPDGYSVLQKSYDRQNRITAQSYLNAQGNLTAGPKRYAKMTLAYDDSEGITVWRAWDRDENPYALSGNAAACLERREEDGAVYYSYLDKQNLPATESHGAYYVRKYTDDRGRECRVCYYDRHGKPFRISDGYAQLDTVYGEKNGLPVEKRYTDGYGGPAVFQNSYSVLKTEYNGRGLPVRCSYLDQNGQPWAEMPYLAYTYDTYGRILSETVQDEQGKPKDRGGWSYAAWEYNDTGSGTTITKSYHSADGKLYNAAEGAAVVQDAYDFQGRWLGARFYNADGDLTVRRSKGYAAIENTYDKNGNRTMEKFIGPDGQPMPVNGRAFRIWEYDHPGKPTLYGALDAEGNPVVSENGYAFVRYAYDTYSNMTGEWYLGADRQPVLLKDRGFAGITYEWDEKGHCLSKTFRDEKENPVVSSYGCAMIRTRWDGRGRAEYEETLDADEKLIVPENRFYAAVSSRYDQFGITERIYYGADGKPVEHNGYAAVRWENDSSGRVVSWSYYNAKNELVVPDSGDIAMLRREFDSFGNVSREAFFGPDGMPSDVRGYYAIAWEYDRNGYLLSISYLDADGRLMPSGDSFIAKKTWTYDENGSWTEAAFYDKDGSLTENETGEYCAVRRKLDGVGRVLEETLLGEDREPIRDEYLYETGYAVARYEYDPAGVRIRESYYTGDGKPASRYRIYHRMELEHDGESRHFSCRYYDTSGNLIRNMTGASVLEWDTDENGRKIRIAGFDADGRSMMAFDENVTSFAVMELSYDPDGYLTRKAVYDTDGNPMMSAFAFGIDTNGVFSFQNFSGYTENDVCPELTHYLQASSLEIRYDEKKRATSVMLYNTAHDPVREEDYAPYTERKGGKLPGIGKIETVSYADPAPFDRLKASEIRWIYTEDTIREVCKAADGTTRTMREISQKSGQVLINAKTDSRNELLWPDRDEPGQGERFIYEENALTIQLINMEGRPVLNRGTGYAAVRIEYKIDDYGGISVTAVRFYDEQNQPVEAKTLHRETVPIPGDPDPVDIGFASGCASVEITDNQRVFYDSLGRIMLNPQQGYAVRVLKWEAGLAVTEYFDPEGRLMINEKEGYARKTVRDNWETWYYDQNGRLMLNPVEGCAGRKGWPFRSGGDSLAGTVEYYGTDEKLMNNPLTGFARRIMIKDSDGDSKSYEFLDAGGNRVRQKDAGCAVYLLRSVETSDDWISEESYLDENGALCSSPAAGYAKKESRIYYDSRSAYPDRETVVYLDAEGRRTVPSGMVCSDIEIKHTVTEVLPGSYADYSAVYRWTDPDGRPVYSEEDHCCSCVDMRSAVPYIDSVVRAALDETGRILRYELYLEEY